MTATSFILSQGYLFIIPRIYIYLITMIRFNPHELSSDLSLRTKFKATESRMLYKLKFSLGIRF